MIHNSQKQAGSAHVVVIIILVVAIIGVLGYVLWNNFLAPKDSGDTQQTTTQQPQPAAETPKDDTVKAEALTKSYVIPEEKLGLKYPSTWELVKKYEKYGDHKELTDNQLLLISPNNFALQISVPSHGPGWPFGERINRCPYDNGVYDTEKNYDSSHCATFTSYLSQPAKGLKGHSVMVFKTRYPGLDSFLTLTLVKDGCKGLDSVLCERPKAKTGFYIYVSGDYYKNVSQANKDEVGMYTDAESKQVKYKDFIKSQDVLTATAILQSLQYKN